MTRPLLAVAYLVASTAVAVALGLLAGWAIRGFGADARDLAVSMVAVGLAMLAGWFGRGWWNQAVRR